MIGKDKERINFTISKDVKEKLVYVAEIENRTMSNAINTAILEYITRITEEQKKKNHRKKEVND